MSITASTRGFVQAAVFKYRQAQEPKSIAWLESTLQQNLDPYCLTQLAKLAYDNEALKETLHQVYTITTDSNGQKVLTGSDNNSLSLDRLVLDTIPRFTALVTTPNISNFPIIWKKHKIDLYTLADLDDFVFAHVGQNRTLILVNKDGPVNGPQANVTFNFGAMQIPVATAVTNVDLQQVLVDIMVQSVQGQQAA